PAVRGPLFCSNRYIAPNFHDREFDYRQPGLGFAIVSGNPLRRWAIVNGGCSKFYWKYQWCRYLGGTERRSDNQRYFSLAGPNYCERSGDRFKDDRLDQQRGSGCGHAQRDRHTWKKYSDRRYPR